MRSVLFLVAAIILGVLGASGANAAQGTTLSIRLCNHYREVADFALAYQESGSWVSRGWWRVPPGGCSTDPAVVPADTVYLNYVFPATQTGLVHATHRFAVNTNVDHSFRIQTADQSKPGTELFSFISSPTYVGSSTFKLTFTMLENGSTIQW